MGRPRRKLLRRTGSASMRSCRPWFSTWAQTMAFTRTPKGAHSELSSRVICATAPIAML